MKLYFGIPTYNRKVITSRSLASLRQMDGFPKIEAHIFDDCSTEYDAPFLQSLLPEAAVTVRERNLGADLNVLQMLRDFLESGCDVFVNADSDLIYRRDCVEFIEANIEAHPFFSCLQAESSHPVIEAYANGFCRKEAVGAAGCCMQRQIAALIVSELPWDDTPGVDWRFCRLLQKHEIPVLSTDVSYVQHIGFCGENSGLFGCDLGRNFLVDSPLNGQILNDCLAEYFDLVRAKSEEKTLRNFCTGIKHRILACPARRYRAKR